MSVITLVADEATLKKLTYFYTDNCVKTPPHALFQAKIPDCTITAYKSKKVVFQGKGAEKEAAIWQGFGSETTPTKTPKPVVEKTLKFNQYNCIGCDESGVGDYFGPVTAACVFLQTSDLPTVQALGVTDSKQMTDDLIRKIAPTIMQNFPHAITVLPNPKYNALQAQGINGHMMKALLHNQALTKLLAQPLSYELIVMDQFVNERAYYRYFETLQMTPVRGLTFLPKAENQCAAVACASVLARYTYLMAMDKLAIQLGKPLPKGANKAVDQFAADLISAHGVAFLDTYAKLHFATTAKATALT